MSTKKLQTGVLICILMFCSGANSANIILEITKGRFDGGIPVAIVPFSIEGDDTSTNNPSDIIEADLNFSGKFNTVSREKFLSHPNDLQSVQFKDWRLIKVDAIVVGKVINIGNGQLEVRFRLLDVLREKTDDWPKIYS